MLKQKSYLMSFFTTNRLYIYTAHEFPLFFSDGFEHIYLNAEEKTRTEFAQKCKIGVLCIRNRAIERDPAHTSVTLLLVSKPQMEQYNLSVFIAV